MNILFRINAGRKYGLGHLIRNIYLSNELINRNFNTEFLIKTDDVNFIREFLIEKKINLNVHYIKESLSQKQDLSQIFKTARLKKCKMVILDHYEHNRKYLKSIKEKKLLLVNFDVSKNTNHISDLIINPNLGFTKKDYLTISKKTSKLCIGNKYLIINPALKKKKSKKRKKENILISFGGGQYPERIYNLIDKITNNKNLNFIVISSDIRVNSINKTNTKVYFGNLDYNKIYCSLQYAIVSGGVTSQELAYYNIPMLIYPYAKNHKKTMVGLIENNLAIRVYSNELLKLNNFKLPKLYPKVMIDNKGISRIVKKISEIFFSTYSIEGDRINLRPLEISDTKKIIKWRNDTEIKRWMNNQESISKSSHLEWFNNRKKRFDFIIEEKTNKTSIGTVNIKLKSNSEAELGKLIGETDFLGKGYAKESFKLLINFAFDKLLLSRLFVITKKNNKKNINLNSKLGFKICKKAITNSDKLIKMYLIKNEK